MGIDTILRLAGGAGPLLALIALLIAIGIGIGILIYTVRGLGKSLIKQNQTFNDHLTDVKIHSDERDRKLEELVAKQDVRLSFIETKYASKEDMYKALGGWRQEISQLHHRIDRVVDSTSRRGESA